MSVDRDSDTDRRDYRGIALAATAMALGLRLVFALVWPLDPVSDAAHYDAIARGLAHGAGFEGAFRPPLYPLFLSLAYRLFGESLRAACVAQALLDTGTCLLVAAWARARFGSTVGVITLGLAAVSMSAVASVRVLLSESLAAFFLVATLALFDVALRRRPEPTLRTMALVGVLAGALTLTRGIMLLLPLGLALVVLLERNSSKASMRRRFVLAAALFAGYTGALTPWLLRNVGAVGGPVLTTQVGITFYSSHFLEEGQPYGVLTRDAVTRAAQDMTPLQSSRYLVRETLNGLRRDPLVAVTAYPAKLALLLIPIDYEVMGHRQINWSYLVVVVLTGFGLLVAHRKEPLFTLLALMPLVYLCLMAFPFYGSPRFRLPAEPLLLPVAAVGGMRLAEAIRSRKRAIA